MQLVVSQEYDTHVNQEYVIRGNDVLLRCGIPSHVQDLVDVVSWHDSSNKAGDEFRYISPSSINGKGPPFLLAVIHMLVDYPAF